MTDAPSAGDRPPTDRPLDIDADLTLDVDGETVSIRGYGDLIVVSAPSVGVAWSLARTAGPLLDQLSAADVTLDCRVQGRSIARVVPGDGPGPLSRTLGLAPARLSVGGLLLAALATRS
ncbi:peptide ABC transporter ATP-binding protein [Haloplanus halobius]|uniref:peptide ABC transporter ATP-binding protein n=1 Tax=Haloplanus halobius TaxID=2934938 RepID=UPI00200DA8C8|nr:peptide ABC transporter ATP-binding protein [Haloplanus sp. XH21]